MTIVRRIEVAGRGYDRVCVIRRVLREGHVYLRREPFVQRPEDGSSRNALRFKLLRWVRKTGREVEWIGGERSGHVGAHFVNSREGLKVEGKPVIHNILIVSLEVEERGQWILDKTCIEKAGRASAQ